MQLQWENPTFENRGDPYISFSNAQFHREYDSTHCKLYEYDVWRTRVKHTGTHGDTVTKVRYSYMESIYCYFNNG